MTFIEFLLSHNLGILCSVFIGAGAAWIIANH